MFYTGGKTCKIPQWTQTVESWNCAFPREQTTKVNKPEATLLKAPWVGKQTDKNAAN